MLSVPLLRRVNHWTLEVLFASDLFGATKNQFFLRNGVYFYKRSKKTNFLYIGGGFSIDKALHSDLDIPSALDSRTRPHNDSHQPHIKSPDYLLYYWIKV